MYVLVYNIFSVGNTLLCLWLDELVYSHFLNCLRMVNDARLWKQNQDNYGYIIIYLLS